MLGLIRALVWLGFSAGLLIGGFSLLSGGLLGQAIFARGEAPGEVQLEALAVVFSALVTQALLPTLGLAFASWFALARLAPALERSRTSLALGLFVCTALWFPLVGHYSFAIWTPRNARDYAFTLLLVAGGAALALWLPRAVSPVLAPGCFTSARRRGIVGTR